MAHSLKYSSPGPLQEKRADPWAREHCREHNKHQYAVPLLTQVLGKQPWVGTTLFIKPVGHPLGGGRHICHLLTALQVRHDYPHFIEEDTEAPRADGIGPRSPSWVRGRTEI